MLGQQPVDLGRGALQQRRGAGLLPLLEVAALEQGGVPVLPVVGAGVRRIQELAVGADLVDQVEGQRLVVDLAPGP